jgi:hypothetical protein
MKKEFIPYAEALALKELGFDEPCIRYYFTDGVFFKTYNEPFNFNKRYCEVSAPLYQQAFRWFRTKHGYFTSPTEKDDDVTKQYDWVITKNLGNGKTLIQFVGYKDSYEEAELECLMKLIEIVNEKN